MHRTYEQFSGTSLSGYKMISAVFEISFIIEMYTLVGQEQYQRRLFVHEETRPPFHTPLNVEEGVPVNDRAMIPKYMSTYQIPVPVPQSRMRRCL